MEFNLEKFSNIDPYLGIKMKSIGETMTVGKNFKEAFYSFEF